VRFLAYIGPATGIIQVLAGSIGAGLVVGGFVGGSRALLVSRSRLASEESAFAGGYIGGAVGLFLLLVDTLVKSFV
jgi:hypothetical protein